MLQSDELNKIKYFEHHSIEYVKTTSSTNDDLKKLWPLNANKVLIADEQTAGRGQLDRQWSSKKGNGIYFSFTWQASIEEFENNVPLSILAGVAAFETIKILAKNDSNKLWLKWPNDIWLNDNKLAGILVESFFEEKRVNFVIGIGINIHPFKTNELSTSGLSELLPSPSITLFLRSFFKKWSTITDLEPYQQMTLWKTGANMFFNTKHQLFLPDGTHSLVLPFDVNINGKLSVKDESGKVFTLNSCQKLIPKLDKQ